MFKYLQKLPKKINCNILMPPSASGQFILTDSTLTENQYLKLHLCDVKKLYAKYSSTYPEFGQCVASP